VHDPSDKHDPEIVPALLEASRTLRAEDVQTLAYWDGSTSDFSRVAAMGRAFGRHWTEMGHEEVGRVTAILERFMLANQASGDLIATGFLESLVAVLHGDSKEERVIAALGPRSREYYQFWTDY
jgi:hypothetical protein